MEHRRLGSQGPEVSVIGVGTWPMGGTHRPGDYGAVDDRTAVDAIRAALDAGVTLFDTAPTYGDGRAEELLGRALGADRARAIVASKCGTYWDAERRVWVADSSRDAIEARLEGSLRRLGTDYLDLLIVHIPDRSRSAADVVETLDGLVDRGRVRHYGVSNFSAEELADYAQHGRVVAQQVSYHMFDRRPERRVLPTCEALGVGVMSFGSLAHGLLTGSITAETTFPDGDWRAKGTAFGLDIFSAENLPRNVEVVERLADYARQRGHTVAQLALAWVLRQSAVATALVGVRNAAELDDNLGALDFALDSSCLDDIDAILAEAAGTSADMPEYRVS